MRFFAAEVGGQGPTDFPNIDHSQKRLSPSQLYYYCVNYRYVSVVDTRYVATLRYHLYLEKFCRELLFLFSIMAAHAQAERFLQFQASWLVLVCVKPCNFF